MKGLKLHFFYTGGPVEANLALTSPAKRLLKDYVVLWSRRDLFMKGCYPDVKRVTISIATSDKILTRRQDLPRSKKQAKRTRKHPGHEMKSSPDDTSSEYFALWTVDRGAHVTRKYPNHGRMQTLTII